MPLNDARKTTLTNILQQMYKDVRHYGYARHNCKNYTDTRILRLAKRLGVEIETDSTKWPEYYNGFKFDENYGTYDCPKYNFDFSADNAPLWYGLPQQSIK